MILCNGKCSPVFLKEELENMGSCLGCYHHLYNYKTQTKQLPVCKTAANVQSDKGSLSHIECFLENSQRAVLGCVGQSAELYATSYCQQLPLLESMPALSLPPPPLLFLSLSLSLSHTEREKQKPALCFHTERLSFELIFV